MTFPDGEPRPFSRRAFVVAAGESTRLSIDLAAIDLLPTLTDSHGAQYKYDIPTLDDPSRANANGIEDPLDAGYDGIDVIDRTRKKPLNQVER